MNYLYAIGFIKFHNGNKLNKNTTLAMSFNRWQCWEYRIFCTATDRGHPDCSFLVYRPFGVFPTGVSLCFPLSGSSRWVISDVFCIRDHPDGCILLFSAFGVIPMRASLWFGYSGCSRVQTSSFAKIVFIYSEPKSFCHQIRPAFGKVLLWAGLLSGYLLSSFFNSVEIRFNSKLSAITSTKYSLSSVADCGRDSRSNFIRNVFLSESKSVRSSKDKFGSVNLMSTYSGLTF